MYRKMDKIFKDAIIILIIFFLGFAIAYYIYNMQEWFCPTSSITAESITTMPLFDKNYASLLISEINNANGSIDIAMFEFKFYENEKNDARKILDALILAKQRNVSIRILLDSSGWNDEVTKENNETISYLKKNGIDAKFDNPKKTLHAKLIIIDNKIFIGSHNLGFHALERNNEASIFIENNDIAEQYRNYFEWLWKQS